MSLLDRNNPYKFDEFLEWRKGVDYYRDDPFFQKVVKYYTKDKWPKIHEAAEAFSAKASFRWRDLAEAAAVPEKRPYMTHYDGHGHRIDRIDQRQVERRRHVQQDRHHIRSHIKGPQCASLVGTQRLRRGTARKVRGQSLGRF